MAQAVIRVENLVHIYPRGEVKALKGINLDINKGDVVSIVGTMAAEKPHWCATSTVCCAPPRARYTF